MKCLLVAFMLSVSLIAQAESVPSLASIDIELDKKQSLPLSNKISFQLHSTELEELEKISLKWNNITVKQSDKKALTVSILGQTNFLGKVHSKHSTKSFVIDYEEDSVRKLTDDFKKLVGQLVSVQELERFVHNQITDPTYINGFHIASVVATQRSGDCTEYSVLSTALARSLGLPSKVVLGTVIVETTDRVLAIGHAWSEVWLDGKWQILDAALFGAQDKQRFYLPAADLENEGPGYSLSLMSAVNQFPKKISNLRNYKQDQGQGKKYSAHGM